MKNQNISLEDETFEMLRNMIYEKSGIYFLKNKKYLLENRLLNRVRECNLDGFKDYYFYLKYNQEEQKRLFDVITTNETSFFRYPPQLDTFEKNVLPEVLNKNRQIKRKRIRIWSAGCSTGQEPYTLAIILLEHELKFKGWDIEIVANDISEGVIQSAKNGIYRKSMIENMEQKYINRYFESAGENYRLKDVVKKVVKFDNANLIEKGSFERYRDFDIVFCRNVLIYFDETAKKRVIGRIYDALIPNGYLFIGHSESLHNISKAFKPIHYDKAIIYKKE